MRNLRIRETGRWYYILLICWSFKTTSSLLLVSQNIPQTVLVSNLSPSQHQGSPHNQQFAKCSVLVWPRLGWQITTTVMFVLTSSLSVRPLSVLLSGLAFELLILQLRQKPDTIRTLWQTLPSAGGDFSARPPELLVVQQESWRRLAGLGLHYGHYTLHSTHYTVHIYIHQSDLLPPIVGDIRNLQKVKLLRDSVWLTVV